MFDHVTIRVSDRKSSERFYDTVLGAIGVEKGYSEDSLAEWGDFSIAPANADPPDYGAYVLDPGGNNVEVVNHNRRSGCAGSR